MNGETLLMGPASPEKLLAETITSGFMPQVVTSTTESTPLKNTHPDAFPIPEEKKHTETPKKEREKEDNETVTMEKEKEVNETVKSLTERLSAALSTITAKEELVKQHAKVAEEAVAGWEQAEKEVINLKQQLEATSHKNISLEEQINHLDTALKECVRQLRQSRDEQPQKILEAISAKSQEWESRNTDLETQLNQLKSHENELHEKMMALEKENRDLKANLIARYREVELLQVERDLSNQAAETASKQHLESVKKVVKVEAECRRLRVLNARTRPPGNSTYVESVTDSQSDSGDRALCTTDSDTGGPETWASALIAELDQFKNGSACPRNITNSSSVEIDLMDDFLEMERLAAAPIEPETGEVVQTRSEQAVVRDGSELGSIKDEMERLHAKLDMVEREKVELAMALEASRSQLELSEAKLLEIELQLDLANETQRVYAKEIDDLEEKRHEVELQLESALLHVRELQLNVSLLEEKIEAEKILCTEYKQKFESTNADKEALEDQIELLEKSQSEKLGLLEKMLNEERIKSEEAKLKLEAEIKSQEKSYSENVRLLEEKMKEERVKSEGMKVELEAQIESLEKSHLETVRSLEDVKEEKINLEELRVRSEIAETEKEELKARLETSMSEVSNLRGKLGLLEGQIEKERLLSEEFEAKCRKLEAQLERQRLSLSNGELKTKQEKELAMAAGKLAECQKTIASLGQQLKSLTNLQQEIVLEPTEGPVSTKDSLDNSSYTSNEEFDLRAPDDFAHDLIRFTRVNGNGQLQYPPRVSPFSGFSGFSSLTKE
ncbi:filament-like protein (DUF869) [Rhynchospora pubera]|uniref:Filament-like protein (DUF869) n=1 Tax=Rhynchospora pubera TaxID=906938 RepID=A0AAV8ARV2_9POAL|nr:filament-like protein (DUF869) [Rhynchospora pubera]KAJ4751503.1 filament-like protein (DUF869) [Rhynchospora pubera]